MRATLSPFTLVPSAGATGPVTEPGVALLSVAEILAMLATAQVVRPGTPIVATPLIFSMDMRTGKSLQSSAESLRSNALAAQFIKAAFGLPTHTYGTGSDSPTLDGQCTSEGALRAMLAAASGADILGAAGQIETATTISPVQLVIDDEVFGVVRRVIAEMKFDDESLAWEDLLNVEPGGAVSHDGAHAASLPRWLASREFHPKRPGRLARKGRGRSRRQGYRVLSRLDGKDRVSGPG